MESSTQSHPDHTVGRVHTLDVILEEGWKIQFRGYRFGPYATKREAIATAQMWADNGRKHGHQVTVVVAGDSDERDRFVGSGNEAAASA
jgi:hypothetical protein